ncbi:hypothetical protein JTE90_015795 [Oedothorax gibbosus]|uniref:DDE Tnp4 domain-containing protein n=1 Tax=Oedothorax gibbosus TaxID=931172 RepID=A0AAV6TLH8_9ARAC|nr:hypothetical protein JTE90_015795 [Oedothorax gibbosus]
MCIPPKEMLAVTLRYFASGCSLGDFFYTYRIGTTTASQVVKTTSRAIWNALNKTHFHEATQGNWLDIANNFAKNSNFPLCLGAIDGKHVRIEKFPNEGSMNFNYKKFQSIVLLAVADADYKFIYVNVGGFGKDCDSNIFQQTSFWKLLTQKKLNLPDPAPLPPQGLKVPYVFVADDAFPMHEHVMRGYGGHNLTTKQKVFNYRLCRARRYVECSFGILTNKWRIFHRPLNLSRQSAVEVVKACVVLHNIVRERDGYRFEDLLACPLQPITNVTPTSRKTGRGIRTCYANYFVSNEGALSWQLSKI